MTMITTSRSTEATQIIEKRDPFVQEKCTECGEGILLHQEKAKTPSGWAHWDCAGVEGYIASCPDCFMILSDCICD